MESTDISDSETNLTMYCDTTFNRILEEVKSSKLNFHLQQSPYSAFISLKKSFQKDRSGTLLVPDSSYALSRASLRDRTEDLLQHNKELLSELETLRLSYTEAREEVNRSKQRIIKLEE